MAAAERTEADLRAAIARVSVWYHSLELAPGVVTPGYFDLRDAAGRLPWPDVRGKRCLDVASFDGFYAFELERRGAAEVVATDVNGPEDFDWPPHLRDWGPQASRQMSPEHAAGFDVAKEVLGSSVERVRVSVYDLDPDDLGRFDIVTCGSLLLHLRDPLRALEAIRNICEGQFLSVDQVDPVLTRLHPRRPVGRIDGLSRLMQWTVPNVACHRRILEAAGFAIEQTSKPFMIGYGSSHSMYGVSARRSPRQLARRLVEGGNGVLHHAALCRPSI